MTDMKTIEQAVSDRILVMCEGRITAELQNENLQEDDVIRYAFSS